MSFINDPGSFENTVTFELSENALADETLRFRWTGIEIDEVESAQRVA